MVEVTWVPAVACGSRHNIALRWSPSMLNAIHYEAVKHVVCGITPHMRGTGCNLLALAGYILDYICDGRLDWIFGPWGEGFDRFLLLRQHPCHLYFDLVDGTYLLLWRFWSFFLALFLPLWRRRLVMQSRNFSWLFFAATSGTNSPYKRVPDL